MTERQTKACVLIGIGSLLMMVTGPLAGTLVGTASPLVMAGVHLLSPLGVIVAVLGVYRFSTKGKQ